ncbi:hypothetical protein QP794_17165 [Paenibacillus sp. UMB7766-LJ446]|uniref:hypothetical protein n=1 Tax=Paenibacillus sp. UMB7766-LJ446 TaxID=3046313 RepID=UPI00255022CB|nr:hypothetical protein [Paenibacillus sp. UMB7766-LJ446]MDK8191822.1 hypothetical protein [Paenibacillus sp. UMB7766-LJ446]
MSNWEKFQDGMSKGFDEFMEVTKGKDLRDAMSDIKNHFEEKDDNNNDKKK